MYKKKNIRKKIFFGAGVLTMLLMITPSNIAYIQNETNPNQLIIDKFSIEPSETPTLINNDENEIDIDQISVEWPGILGPIYVNDNLNDTKQTVNANNDGKVYLYFKIHYIAYFIGDIYPMISRAVYFSLVCKINGKIISDPNQERLDEKQNEIRVIIECDPFVSEKNETVTIECCVWVTARIEIFGIEDSALIKIELARVHLCCYVNAKIVHP